MQPTRFRTLIREKELWLVILFGILYFYRLLLPGETVFFRDLLYDFIPQKRLLMEFFQHGEWPLWDVFRHGGQPYFADPNNSAFHPANILFVLLPFFRAFNLFLVLHALLSLTGTYLFLRRLQFSPISSLTASIIYGFCGYSLSLVNLFGRFLAMAYLPFLFLVWHEWLQEKKWRWFVLTVALGVVQVLSGAPEVNIISLLSLLGWTLFYPYQHVSLSRRCLAWIVLGVFIIGIASIQLFPTAEMVMNSSRGAGMDYTEFSSSSLHPKRLPELFVPNFSGYIDFLPYTDYYWGVSLTDGDDYPYILNIYFGWVALILGIIGGISPISNELLPRKLRIGLLVLFLGSVLLSLGRSLPFFRLFYQHVPLISLFRYPMKFLIAGLFPLAILAGHTTEQYVKNGQNVPDIRQRGPMTAMLILWAISACFSGLTLLFSFSRSFASQFQTFFFQHSNGEFMFQSLRHSLLQATVMLVAFTMLAHYHRCSPKRWQGWGVVFLVSADLLSAGIRVNVTASEEFFTDRPPLVQAVEQAIGDGRFMRVENPDNIQLFAPSNEVIWGYRWNLETLDNYLAAFYHIPVLFHDDYVGLGQHDLMTLKALVHQLPWPQKLPILSASGITTIFTAERLSVPGIQHLATVPNRSSVEFHLYRNTRAVPRTSFVTNWRTVHADADALHMMSTPDYDPRQTVLIQASAPSIFSSMSIRTHKRTRHIPDTSLGSACQKAHIDVLRSNSDHKEYSVSTPCDGFLVFSEPFYPGWKVTIDGNPSELFRANFAFSAIFLPQGEHNIRHFYLPDSLIAGAIVSLLFCGLLIGGILLKRVKAGRTDDRKRVRKLVENRHPK